MCVVSVFMFAQPYFALQMNHINAHNAEMLKHIAAVEGHTALLKGQLQQTETHWNRALADNTRLHQQMAVLTARIEVLQLFCYGLHHACPLTGGCLLAVLGWPAGIVQQ